MAPAEPLRIAMVLESTYPVAGGGGAESQLATLSRYLRRRGHQVSIVVPMTPAGAREEHDRVDGIPVWRIPYPRVRVVGGIVMLARLAWHLFANRRRYDVFHVHIAHHMAAVACVVGRLAGKPVLVKLTGWLESELGILSRRRSPVLWLLRRCIRLATAVQATSRELEALLVKHGFPPARIHRIPNAVDTHRFRPQAGARTGDGAAFTAIFVGRLVPEKNLPMLLEAWAVALAGRDDARLMVVGQGPLAEELAGRARSLGIARQVAFLGAQPREEVIRLLGRADVGVLVSTHEGLSNSLLEYMAAGLPVIGTRISGTEDWVREDDTGWLVEPGDTAALAQVLARAAGPARPHLADMGRRARAVMEREASIPAVADRILRAYGAGPGAGGQRLRRAA